MPKTGIQITIIKNCSQYINKEHVSPTDKQIDNIDPKTIITVSRER